MTRTLQLLDVDGVAKLLGQMFRPDGQAFTRRTIERWRRTLQMPHHKIGGRVSFDEAVVIRWATKRFVKGKVE